jgi:hypothetical protein
VSNGRAQTVHWDYSERRPPSVLIRHEDVAYLSCFQESDQARAQPSPRTTILSSWICSIECKMLLKIAELDARHSFLTLLRTCPACADISGASHRLAVQAYRPLILPHDGQPWGRSRPLHKGYRNLKSRAASLFEPPHATQAV